MPTMQNRNRSTYSPAHLDTIETGCIIDGSHLSADDFNVRIIRYAETLGFEIDNEALVAVLLTSEEMTNILSDEGQAREADVLTTVSDEAVDWLNEHVASEPYVFHVLESDLFLEDAAVLDMDGHTGPIYPERD